MSRIVVQAFITLDGVVQAGGGQGEDPEGGFPFEGWATRYDEEHGGSEVDSIVAQWESKTDALLLGRRTYEIFARSWGVWDENADGLTGKLTRRYNRIPKYVASHTLTDVSWKNTQVIESDVPAAARSLRAIPGDEIRVWGSTQLVRTLAKHDQVDEYRLAVYPIVLGTGKRLFSEGFAPTTLALVDTRTLSSGVVISTYRRAGTG